MGARNVTTQPVTRFDWERVIRRASLPLATKGVALLLASYGNEDGTKVHPGEERLARVSGVTARSVRRHVAQLRDLHLLLLVSRANRFQGKADEYRLVVPVKADALRALDMLDPNERHRTPVSGDETAEPVDNSGVTGHQRPVTGGDTPGATHGSPDIGDGVTGHLTTGSPDASVRPPTHIPTRHQEIRGTSPNVVQTGPVDERATENEIDAEMTAEHAHQILIDRHGVRVHDVIAQHEARCDCADAARHLAATAPTFTVIPGGKTA
jgi:hypothetical protein